MTMNKHFEVKTGKNQGFYIVTTQESVNWTDFKQSKEYTVLAKTWGILPYDAYSNFYKYHHINPNIEMVWTHSHFAGHEYNRKIYKTLLQELGYK